jgi:hypothetical protein
MTMNVMLGVMVAFCLLGMSLFKRAQNSCEQGQALLQSGELLGRERLLSKGSMLSRRERSL